MIFDFSNAFGKFQAAVFNVGVLKYLQAMMRNSGEIDDDEDNMDDLDSDDEDEENIRDAVEKLKVFCVSSAEYIKLKFPRNKDGAPTVSLTNLDKKHHFRTKRCC